MASQFDISTIWLKSSYFFLSNREYFKKWWVILFIAADVFFTIFALTNIILFVFSIPKETKLMIGMAQNQVAYATVREQSKPQQLSLVQAKAFPTGSGRYDLVAELRNNNLKWAASSVSYTFSIGGENTEVRTDFCLPDSQKYLTAENIAIQLNDNGQLPSISVNIEDVDWRRVPDPAVLPEENFSIDFVSYNSATANAGVGAHWVTASVTNQGLVGFWQTSFTVVLLRGSSEIIGMDRVYFNNFQAGETRSLRAQWNFLPGTASRVLIEPDVNLLDQDNIM